MNKICKLLLGVVVIISLSSYVIHSSFFIDDEEKDKIILSMAMGYLDNLHYQTLELNNDFSEKAFDMYLKRLDYNKRFFLQSDVKELENFKDKIDDEIRAESFELYNTANEILDIRHTDVEEFYPDLLDKPFDFSKNEIVEMDHDKREYAKSKTDLIKIWRKDLKYQTLSRLNRKIDAQNKLIADPDQSHV